MASALLSGAPPAQRGAGHPNPDGKPHAAGRDAGDTRAGRPLFRGLLALAVPTWDGGQPSHCSCQGAPGCEVLDGQARPGSRLARSQMSAEVAVKPAPFAYAAPATVAEAVALLAEHAEAEPRVLAGGQSLIPLMNF